MLVATQLAVLAIGSAASAAVVPRDTPNCAPTDDAVTCASNFAKSFNVKASATSANYTVSIPISWGRPPAPQTTANADVSLALTNCQLTQPVVTKGTAFTCTTACKSPSLLFHSP